MALDRAPWSPYNAMRNNPLSNLDPTGMLDAPVYDQSGSFLGTDDQGLQGKAIVMDKSQFKQNMSHSDALKKDLGLKELENNNALSKLVKSYNSLKSRGQITMGS